MALGFVLGLLGIKEGFGILKGENNRAEAIRNNKKTYYDAHGVKRSTSLRSRCYERRNEHNNIIEIVDRSTGLVIDSIPDEKETERIRQELAECCNNPKKTVRFIGYGNGRDYPKEIYFDTITGQECSVKFIGVDAEDWKRRTVFRSCVEVYVNFDNKIIRETDREKEYSEKYKYEIPERSKYIEDIIAIENKTKPCFNPIGYSKVEIYKDKRYVDHFNMFMND